jgi:hypothetical protein
VSEDAKRPEPDHEPDLNALAAHAEGRLGSAESEALLDHLSECSSCRNTAALMVRALAADPSATRRRIPAAARWLALAATLLVATIVGLRVSRDRPDAPTTPAPRPTSGPAAASVPAAAPDPSPQASTAPLPSDRKRGGADRKIADKSFRLIAGEWVDAAYQPAAGLPVVEASGPEARRRLLEEHPALAPYLAARDRILVVLDGTVYRVEP